MDERKQLRNLMESFDETYSPVPEAVGDADPMTGDIETMPDDVMSFDWKVSPEEVLKTLNQEIGAMGIQFEVHDNGDDMLHVSIRRVDH